MKSISNKVVATSRRCVPVARISLLLAATITVSAQIAQVASAAKPTTTVAKSKNPLPVMNVTDVTTGKPVALAKALGPTKALLVWFWAPQCGYCNAQAQAVERFVAANSTKFDAIGLGTQDSLIQAKEFKTRHKISKLKLVWDSTGKSWAKLGIAAQPAWMLIKPDGTIVGSSLGEIPYTEILKKL